MFKKLKVLFLSILIMLGLASCIEVQSTTKYSFKDITNYEISEIYKVSISQDSMISSIENFDGDYEKILDVEYILSDISYNETRKIINEYKFRLLIDLNPNDTSNLDIDFYIYNYKLYYFTDEALYESKDKVNYDDFDANNEEVETINLFVELDYGRHIKDKVTTLLDYSLIWFNIKEYGIDTLVAGDELIIKYTGEYLCEDSYPGHVIDRLIQIQSIEVIEADIVEFKVLATPGSEKLELVPVDSKYDRYVLTDSNNEGYVASKDGSFKEYSQYSNGTTIYASLPKTTGSIRVDGLYDYNPRSDKILETGQFEVSIIDESNCIIDDLSSDAGMYTPGMLLEFHSHPLTDVDLAMYVNNEFYGIQVYGDHMWNYTFVMPSYDVVIEFKISSGYSDVGNVLNIPNLSVNDIVKVRYERGYIGVAPGSLTDIAYSTDFEDKNMLLSLLEMPVYEDNTNHWQVTGGGYTLYTIFTKEGRYDIEITNDYILINQKHYRFLGQYIFFEYPSLEAHSYVTYQDTYEVFTMDDVKIGDFNGLSEYEFIKYPYDTIFENEALGYLETEIGRLYILSENIFYFKDKNTYTYFLVVGEKNFANFF